MREPTKVINLELPLKLYEQLLHGAVNNGQSPAEYIVSTIVCYFNLANEKPEFIAFLEELDESEEIRCPVYRRAKALLDFIHEE